MIDYFKDVQKQLVAA